MSAESPSEHPLPKADGDRGGRSATIRSVGVAVAIAAVLGGMAGAFPAAVPVLARPWVGPLVIALVVWLAVTSLSISRGWEQSRRFARTAWPLFGLTVQVGLFGVAGFCHYRTLSTAGAISEEAIGPAEILKRLDLSGDGAPDEAHVAAAVRASVEEARKRQAEQASFAGYCRHRYRRFGRIPMAAVWLSTLGEWIVSTGLLFALSRRAESSPSAPSPAT